MDERNEREKKVKALALELPVDPLQMRAPPIISAHSFRWQPKQLHTYTHASRTHKDTHQLAAKQKGRPIFLSEMERRRERRRGRREIII